MSKLFKKSSMLLVFLFVLLFIQLIHTQGEPLERLDRSYDIQTKEDPLQGRQSIQEEMYYRYLDFPDYVKGGKVVSHWMNDGNSFWFAEETDEGTIIFGVDPDQNRKKPFFNTAKLREALRQKLDHEPQRKGVPFDEFELSADEKWAYFMIADQRFRLRLSDYFLDTMPSSEINALRSPQRFQNRWGNKVKEKITTDGAKDYSWEVTGWPEPAAMWSPDSKTIVLKKIDDRGVTKLPIVSYSNPLENVDWFLFPWAGERHPKPALYVVDILTKKSMEVKLNVEPGGHIYLIQWHLDGSEFFLIKVDRFYKQFVLLAVDPVTGKTRPLFIEQDEAHFINFHPEGETIFTLLPECKRFIWLSQRDGWRHLYLYDLAGNLVRQLTEGTIPAERIVTVDEQEGWIYFTARPDLHRIYDTHLCRINLEGEKFQQLTEKPGKHESHSYGVQYEFEFSPSKKYFLDTHSSITRPPRVDLRKADGTFLQTLINANTDSLLKLKWEPPEEFVVKAADDITNIYGVLYKPFDFDPEKKYPVIEYVYGTGPVVSRTFIPNSTGRVTQALAQLGFITIMIDVRGSQGRGKIFQNVVYGKIGFYEIADHVTAFHQLAELIENK